jgi:cytochrome c peroxidase
MTRPLVVALPTVVLAVWLGGCNGAPSNPTAAPTLMADRTSEEVEGRRPQVSEVIARNPFGFGLTVNINGGPVVDPSSPFFQSLGINGRSCGTCHEAETGMGLTPERVRLRFLMTSGTDPVFRTNDGSVSPLADVSTVRARASAYKLLLDRALIRIGLPIPPSAEFELIQVEDPYGFASAAELSLFRRPLPSANLRFLSTVMSDGRETFKDPTQSTGFATIHFDLAHQSNSATQGHAQAPNPISDAQRESIVAFEMGLFSAQIWDNRAGLLDAAGATGGPDALPGQEYYFGINDVLGADPEGTPFSPVVMTSYTAWERYARAGDGDDDGDDDGGRRRKSFRNAARAAIARGETLFNTKPIAIKDVGGLNDDLNLEVIPGTCTSCHDTPNAGNHSVPAPLRIGTADPEPVGGSLDVSGLPVYTLRNKATGATVRTTDPGRALITGKWKDVSRFKGPILRGLASRAPYFHNGSARRLEDAVQFYDARFNIGLTDAEKSDLVAFLRAL